MEELMKVFGKHFKKMCNGKVLFRSNITGRELWELYLSSFTEANDPKFRAPDSSSHNCNHCNNFIRRYGNIVSLDKDLNLVTLFDIEADRRFR